MRYLRCIYIYVYMYFEWDKSDAVEWWSYCCAGMEWMFVVSKCIYFLVVGAGGGMLLRIIYALASGMEMWWCNDDGDIYFQCGALLLTTMMA